MLKISVVMLAYTHKIVYNRYSSFLFCFLHGEETKYLDFNFNYHNVYLFVSYVYIQGVNN